MIPGLPIELHYHKFVILMVLISVITVPREKFGRYFWVSLVWGYLGTFLFTWICSDLLHLFEWRYLEEIKFMGANHWFALAWAMAIMVYLRFLPTRQAWYVFPIYLLVFSISSAALDLNFHKLKMLEYYHWNPFYRFLVALIWFYGAAKHQEALEKLPLKKNAEESR